MSRTIDERVVSMQFNNKDFEKNAQQSMSTLDKLKQSLNLLGTGESLKGLGDVDTSGITKLDSAVESVGGKFSVLETVAVGALLRIGQQAVDAGERLVKSFTVDPIMQGWNEYELKMNSVQTIMAGSGKSLEEVNAQLEELNKYADQTIYSFSDMTSNIGKFTNAGVELEDAVAAIKGISNEAALSGANAQEASRAMYNFAQALSSGSVKLIDWKSIENANMATKEFKEQLIQTALEMGTLVQQGDKFVSTTTDAQGRISDAFDAVSNFNNSLSAQWMTNDVVTKTLANYASETTDVGKRANAAATEVKTFSQMVGTIQEAAGSTWAQVFELIFGNFEEGKQLWTDLSEELTSIFVGPMESFRNFIQEWAAFGGNAYLIESVTNIWGALKDVVDAVVKAWDSVFPKASGRRVAEFTRKFRDFTAALKPSKEVLDLITNAARIFFSVWRMGYTIISKIQTVIAKIITSIGLWIINNKDIQKFIGLLASSLEKLYRFAGYTVNTFTTFFELFKETEGFKRLSEYIDNLVTSISNFAGGALSQATSALESFLGLKFRKKGWKLADVVAEADRLVCSFLDTIESAESPLEGLKKWAEDTFKYFTGKEFTSFSDVVSEAFNKISTSIDGVVNAFGGEEGEDKSIKERILGIFTSIKEGLTKGLELVDFGAILNAAKTGGLIWFVTSILRIFNGVANASEAIAKIPKKVTKVLDSLSSALRSYATKLNSEALINVAGAIGILAAALFVVSLIPTDKMSIAAVALGILSLAIVGIMNAIAKIKDSGGDEKAEALEVFSKTVGKALKRFATLFGIAAIIGSVAVAVATLAGVVIILGHMPAEKALAGCAFLAIIVGILYTVTERLSSLKKVSGKAILSILALALAVEMLVIPIKILGDNDWAATLQIVAIIFSLAAAVYAINQTGIDSIKGAASLLLLAVAINALIPPLLILGKNSEMASGGLFIIGAALVGLLGAAYLATTITQGLSILIAVFIAIGGAALLIGAAFTLAGLGFKFAAGAVKSLAENLVPFADAIVEFANKLNENIDIIYQFCHNLVAAIVLAIDEAIPQVGTIIGKLFIAIAEAMINYGIYMKVAIVYLIVDILELIEQEAPALVTRLTIVIANLIVDLADAIVNAFEILGPAVDYVLKSLELLLKEGLSGLLAEVLKTIPVVGEELASKLTGSVGKSNEKLRTEMDAIKSTIETKSNELKSGLESGVTDSSIHGKLTDVVGDIGGVLDNAKSDLFGKGKEVMGEEGVGGGINEGALNIKENLESTLSETLKTGLDPAKTEMFTSGFESLGGEEGFTGGMNSAGDEMTTSLETLMSGNTEFLGLKIADFNTLGGDAMGNTVGYSGGMLSKQDEVEGSADTLAGAVVTELGKAEKGSYESGINVASAFGEGLGKKLSEVIGSARQMVSSFLDTTKSSTDGFDIASPSKKMMWIGEMCAEGFVVGVNDSVGNVKNASKNMAHSAIDSMATAIAETNNAITDGLDVNPTIKPVIDLSDVQNGVNALNGMLGNRTLSTGFSGVSATYPRDLQLISAIRGINGESNSSNSISINVYGAQGQDVNELADAVANKLTFAIQRRKAVYS